jgi:hypothetical protein
MMNEDEPWGSSFKVRLPRLTSSEPAELARLPFSTARAEMERAQLYDGGRV